MRIDRRIEEVLQGVVLRLLLAPFLVACGGSGEKSSTPEAPKVVEVSADLLGQSWQVAFASPEAMGNMASQASWEAYFKKDYEAALPAFEGAAAQARAHAELAAAYRQAALLQSNAIEQTYGEAQAREGDPAEAAYLLGAAQWIQNNRDEALLLFASVAQGASEVAGLKEAAKGWTQETPGKPAFVDLGDPKSGGMPSLPADPHYLLPEQVGERKVEASDPALSLHLSHWHEAAATALDPASGMWLNPWRLPGEEKTSTTSLAAEALFLSPWMTSGDLVFIGDLASAAPSTVELSEHAESSVLAQALQPCQGERVDSECVVDQANGVHSQLMAAMEAAGGASADHPMLADLGRVGVIRAGVRLAQHIGDEQAEGVLRVAALDNATGPSVDPVFQLSMAAWDTRNRNTQRAQDLLHGQRFSVPGTNAIRISLNALSLRVSRDAGAGMPMH